MEGLDGKASLAVCATSLDRSLLAEQTEFAVAIRKPSFIQPIQELRGRSPKVIFLAVAFWALRCSVQRSGLLQDKIPFFNLM
jgi:hypothetical protein